MNPALSLRCIPLGFGATALITSLVVRLHPFHFWTGIVSIFVWAALEALARRPKPKLNQL
jgi:hypothetical protein